MPRRGRQPGLVRHALKAGPASGYFAAILPGLLNTGTQVGAALGLTGLASIASIVTSSRLPGHVLAVALTSGHLAGGSGSGS
jgi:hypothetical protein